MTHYEALLQELGLRGITGGEMEDYEHDLQLVSNGTIVPD